MDFRNCANCNSKTIQTESSNCETREDFSLNCRNMVSTAFENAFLFQNVSNEHIRDLKLCDACSEPLHLFCNSRKLFLKLSSQNSEISRMLKGEICCNNESQWSNKKFMSSEKGITNEDLTGNFKNSDFIKEDVLSGQENTSCIKIGQFIDTNPFHFSTDETITSNLKEEQGEYIIADAEFKNEETILPDILADNLGFKSNPNIGCIKKDIQENNNIIEYQEKIIKMELDKLSEETIAMFSSRTCLISESIKKEDCNYHKCSDCSRIFLESEKLETHRSLTHAVIQPSCSCSFCSKTFSMTWFLKNHLKACHNGIEVYHHCQSCLKKFYSEMDLEDHKLKIHDIRKHQYKCRNCFESFNVIDELRTHLINIHKGSMEADAAENNLKVIAERKLKNQQCSICEEIFDTLFSLRKHRAKEHGENESFECIVCHEKFRSRAKFVKHREIHKNCPECEKTFENYTRIRLHYEKMHAPTSDIPCVCEICGQNYPMYDRLLTHYRWHAEVSGPKHFCYICNKSYKLKAHLKQHLRLAHLEKNKTKHNCPFCDQVFSLKGNLCMHLRDKHEDRMEFPCKLCGKKFLNVESLRSHGRTHTLESGFENVKKTERFKTKLDSVKGIVNGKLEVMACYSSETFLFTCPICSKSCDSQTHFLRHLRMVHALKGYTDPNVKVSSSIKCQVCEKSFARKDLLDKHRRRAHNLTNKTPSVAVVPRSYECPLCKKLITNCTFPAFLTHVNRHEIFVVDRTKCKKTIKKDLNEYYNVQTRKFTCTTCKLIFVKQYPFIRHLKSHSKINVIQDKEKESTIKFPFECDQCPGRAYPSLQLLRRHREGHRFRKDRMQKCDICDVTFRSKKYFQIHMQTEHLKLEEDSSSSS